MSNTLHSMYPCHCGSKVVSIKASGASTCKDCGSCRCSLCTTPRLAARADMLTHEQVVKAETGFTTSELIVTVLIVAVILTGAWAALGVVVFKFITNLAGN